MHSIITLSSIENNALGNDLAAAAAAAAAAATNPANAVSPNRSSNDLFASQFLSANPQSSSSGGGVAPAAATAATAAASAQHQSSATSVAAMFGASLIHLVSSYLNASKSQPFDFEQLFGGGGGGTVGADGSRSMPVGSVGIGGVGASGIGGGGVVGGVVAGAAGGLMAAVTTGGQSSAAGGLLPHPGLAASAGSGGGGSVSMINHNYIVNFLIPLLFATCAQTRDAPRLHPSDMAYLISLLLGMLKPATPPSRLVESLMLTAPKQHHLQIGVDANSTTSQIGGASSTAPLHQHQHHHHHHPSPASAIASSQATAVGFSNSNLNLASGGTNTTNNNTTAATANKSSGQQQQQPQQQQQQQLYAQQQTLSVLAPSKTLKMVVTQSVFLALKLVVLSLDRDMMHELSRIASVTRLLCAKAKSIYLWRFLLFVCEHKTSLFLVLRPFIGEFVGTTAAAAATANADTSTSSTSASATANTEVSEEEQSVKAMIKSKLTFGAFNSTSATANDSFPNNNNNNNNISIDLVKCKNAILLELRDEYESIKLDLQGKLSHQTQQQQTNSLFEYGPKALLNALNLMLFHFTKNNHLFKIIFVRFCDQIF